jgi:hypothetical protein
MIKDEMISSNINHANQPRKLGMLHHDIVIQYIERVIRGRNKENSVGEPQSLGRREAGIWRRRPLEMLRLVSLEVD